MRHNRIRSTFCSAIVLGAAAFCSVPASAETAYDGLWNVTIVTKSGSCEPTARYPLTVTDGKVTAPGADVSGKVGREGIVKVSIGAAYANGVSSKFIIRQRICMAAEIIGYKVGEKTGLTIRHIRITISQTYIF